MSPPSLCWSSKDGEKQQECNKIIIFQLTNYLRCFVLCRPTLLSFQEVPSWLLNQCAVGKAATWWCIWDGQRDETGLRLLAKIRSSRGKRNLMNEIHSFSRWPFRDRAARFCRIHVHSTIFALAHTTQTRGLAEPHSTYTVQWCTFWCNNLLGKALVVRRGVT